MNQEHVITMKIEVNPKAKIKVEQFTDNCFCVVVDDFLSKPDELVAPATVHFGNS